MYQFVCDRNAMQDAGKEGYLRPSDHIGLRWIIGQTIIFSSCFFLLSSFFSSFFSSPNLSGRRLDVYHTLAHGVALARI